MGNKNLQRRRVRGHGAPVGREERARDRRVEGDRAGDRHRHGGGRGAGDDLVAEAGRPREGGGRDRRRGRGVRRQRRRARPGRGLRGRHRRAPRRPRHPCQQRRHKPVLRPGHRHRPAPLRQDLPGQRAGRPRLDPAGVALLDERARRMRDQCLVDGRPALWRDDRDLRHHQGRPHPPDQALGRGAGADRARQRHRPRAGEDRLRQGALRVGRGGGRRHDAAEAPGGPPGHRPRRRLPGQRRRLVGHRPRHGARRRPTRRRH